MKNTHHNPPSVDQSIVHDYPIIAKVLDYNNINGSAAEANPIIAKNLD